MSRQLVSSSQILRVVRHPSWAGILGLVLIIAIGYFIQKLSQPKPASPQPTPSIISQAPTSSSNQVLGVQTKTSGCAIQNSLPDPACSPGAILSNATTTQICQSGYSSSVRNVTTATKDQVYAEYGVTSHQPGQYEIDHIISLELGGSNDIANLFPQPADPRPGFHEKDQVENYLHSQVCSGKMSLADAQHQIATNWLAVYQSMPK